MIDSGANVNIGPPALADKLQLSIVPHTDKRGIGTAKSNGVLVIIGWIFPSGYTGPIAIVKEAAFTLLAVINLQRNGMGCISHMENRHVHCTLEMFRLFIFKVVS